MSTSSAIEPLRSPVFRMLWLAWLAANLTMWANDVAAAWLMTTLTDSALMVALVQAASTLPVFLLGLPSGALADIIDRKRFLAATQVWVALIALVLCALALADGLSAPLLLALTFLNGIGMAMRWPVFSAIVPELVPRTQLGPAIALNGVAMNLSRVLGPIVAGSLLAGAGPAAVFALNAALAVFSFTLIMRWKSPRPVRTLPGERFLAAMRVGLQHVMQTPRLRVILLRVFMFFLSSTALTALMPLLARRLGAGAGGFTLLLAATGCGAVFAALVIMPRLRDRVPRDRIVLTCTLVHAACSVTVALVPALWMAVPVVMIAGMAWMSCANTLTVSAQMALPDWVRARGMSIYQMGLMGGSAAGAALWGQVAGLTSVPTGLFAAAACGPLVLLFTRHLRIGDVSHLDHTPVHPGVDPTPAIRFDPDAGPVMVTVEYLIDPAKAQEFVAVMQATRQARLRQGALSWGLFRDIEQDGRYIEYFLDETWTEHLRRLQRFTADDLLLRERRLAFHRGEGPPRVQRYLASEPTDD